MQEYSNLNLKMIVDVPQILWHDNSARVMSLDFYPNSNYLVTGSVMSDEDTGIRVSAAILLFVNEIFFRDIGAQTHFCLIVLGAEMGAL